MDLIQIIRCQLVYIVVEPVAVQQIAVCPPLEKRLLFHLDKQHVPVIRGYYFFDIGFCIGKEIPAGSDIFKDLIIRAYGVKSLDGKRFIKNDEVRDEFVQSEAYSELFMELATNAESASEFINGIIPQQNTDTPAIPAPPLHTV